MMNNIETMKLALEYLQDNQHHIADNERHVYVMEYNAFIERFERIIAEAEQAEPAPMSQPNRLIAYSAADKLRSLGYQWDEKTAAWQAEQAQLVQRAEDAFERYEAKSDKCLMENAQGDLERVTLVQTGVGIGKAEFTTHAVENAYDWSEWVCPEPKGYLMKCCDCGLVHEADFKVVRYKSETEREDCEPVDDPNVQAVFRMRRSEQWSPVDTAHRAGGLPMEQAEQAKPVAWMDDEMNCIFFDAERPEPFDFDFWKPLYTSPPPRQWVGLTDEERQDIALEVPMDAVLITEAKLKEKNNG